MSESIYNTLHSFRHKHLSIKDRIIFVAFFDTMQNQYTLSLKDTCVVMIIVTQVKHEGFESAL